MLFLDRRGKRSDRMAKKFRRNVLILFILSGLNFINSFKEIILYSKLRELGYLKNPEIAASLGWGEGSVMIIASSALFLISFATFVRSLLTDFEEEENTVEKTQRELRIEQHERAKEGREFLFSQDQKNKKEDNDKDAD